MRGDEFLDELEHVDPALVEEAGKAPPHKGGRLHRMGFGIAAAGLALVLLVGTLLRPWERTRKDPNALDSGAVQAVALAAYPEMVPYPDAGEGGLFGMNEDQYWADLEKWSESRKARLDQPEDYQAGLDQFTTATTRQFLSQSEGENRVYSPLNVYLALGMLAELTDGESRQQILALMGCGDMDTMRTQASAVWNANYCDDGVNLSILASSLWLDEDVDYVPEAMERLADTYYASVYQGEMGSSGLNEAIWEWINAQTHGFLEEQVGAVELDAQTLLALVTTIYYQGRWADEFSPGSTTQEVFHAAEGDVTCDFMHQSATSRYYWGDRFSAVGRTLENNGAMWFILPDEGVSVEELLADDQAMEFLNTGWDWEQNTTLTVNLSVPKFDVGSQMDLIPGLRELGVTDVFDPDRSDFSPTTQSMDGIAVSQVRHGARVAIDEEGCTAAAYTMIPGSGAAVPPEDEVDFVVDRPFLFAITGYSGDVLFVGVVNHPSTSH